jgi:hypothetical protein
MRRSSRRARATPEGRFFNGLLGVPREVIVQDCVIEEHWPVGPVQPISTWPPTDRGHAGIESNTHASLDLQVTASTIRRNHDGIESGNDPLAEGLITVVASTIADNENGIEFNDSDVVAMDSNFQLNALHNGQDGHGGPLECKDYGQKGSPAIGVRGATVGSTPSIFVRRCKFDRNQIGVRIIDSVGSFGDWNLGDANEPGHNCFLTDTQSPWIAGASFSPPPPATNEYWNVPFCAIATQSAYEVQAIGNVWTYAPGGGGNNQLASAAGDVSDCAGLTGTFGDYASYAATSLVLDAATLGSDLNFHDYGTGIQGPLPRPMETGGCLPNDQPSDSLVKYPQSLNNPWNVSIRDDASVHASIRVK